MFPTILLISESFRTVISEKKSKEKQSKPKQSKAPSSKTIIEKKRVDIFICHIIVIIIILIIITVTVLIKTDRYLNFSYQSNSYHFISDDNFQFYQDSTDYAVTKQ